MRSLSIALLIVSSLAPAQHPLQSLIEAGRTSPPAPGFESQVKQYMPGARQGSVAVWGQDYLFAIELDKAAAVSVDNNPPEALHRA